MVESGKKSVRRVPVAWRFRKHNFADETIQKDEGKPFSVEHTSFLKLMHYSIFFNSITLLANITVPRTNCGQVLEGISKKSATKTKHNLLVKNHIAKPIIRWAYINVRSTMLFANSIGVLLAPVNLWLRFGALTWCYGEFGSEIKSMSGRFVNKKHKRRPVFGGIVILGV